jgi:uncharacterized protein YndB with AHSA1/START domain
MSETNEKGVFTILINAPIQRVWSEITSTDKVLNCFFGNRLVTPGLELGAPIRMRTPNDKYTGVAGEVLEFDPPHRYAISFKFTNMDDPPCKITYVLKEVDEGTEFTLIQSDMAPGSKTEKTMKQGVNFVLQTLKADAEDKPLPFMSKFILFMCAITTPFMSKKSLAEKWPFDKEIQ